MSQAEHSLGDAPIEERYREQMNQLAGVIDRYLNHGKMPMRDTGFVLLVFPFNDHGGRCNYISTAERQDVIVLLKEQLARFQGMPEARGKA
jgi:hypothetical protein